MKRQRGFEVVCPACAQPGPAHFPVCWNCQADLPPDLERRESSELPPPGPDPRLAVPRSDDRRGAALELGAVLLVLVLPSILSGLHATWTRWEPPPWDLWHEAYGLLMNLGILALVLTLLRREGPARALGAGRTRVLPELAWALGLVVAAVVSLLLAELVGLRLGLPSWDARRVVPPPGGAFFWFGLPVSFLMVSLAEEVLFRGYAWIRLVQVTGRPWISACVSALIFALAHGYDWAGTLGVFLIGLAASASFLRHRRLWRLVLAHWAFDLWICWWPWIVWGGSEVG